MFNLRSRSFLKEIDFEPSELRFLLELGGSLKTARHAGNEVPRLRGREIALISAEPTARAGGAFEVAAHDQGANITNVGPTGYRLGHEESIADTARVLGRLYDAIELRGSSHEDAEELARHIGVPVYNGHTDEWHPAQMLADFLTMHEVSGKPYHELAYAFVGDCRFNMGRSLLVMGSLMGADVRLAGPVEFQPPAAIVAVAHMIAGRTGARITVTDDPHQAVAGTDFIHTDVWASMGEDKDVWLERVDLLRPYQVNERLLDASGNPRVRFMHRLPAFHDMHTVVGGEIMAQTGMEGGLEVTDEVFESEACVAFDQAENRLHTAKAVLVATLGS